MQRAITIRGKLNLSVAALIAVQLLTVGLAMHAVTTSAERSRSYSRMRELSRFTADLRADITRHLGNADGGIAAPNEPGRVPWPQYALEDIDVQIRLASGDEERHEWQKVRDHLVDLTEMEPNRPSSDEFRRAALRDLEISLLKLRDGYELAEYDSMAKVANTSFNAQIAMALAGVFTMLLFLIYLIMVRDWLVKPIELLKRSTDIIGQGRLDHRVPLTGGDELAQLARQIDAMAEKLAVHQDALLEAREWTAIGELCSSVAHGLRNPLAALRACAQLAERYVDGQGRAKELMDDLIRQADRMNQRITQMFEFSRPSELRRSRINFPELAALVRRESQALLRSRGVSLSVEDRTQDAEWHVDAGQVAASIAELVTNAVHHSPEGGEVILRGETVPSQSGCDAQLRIQVMDRGTGMSRPTLEKAFDLFFTTRPEGSGVGLAMVRRVVDRHDGQITAESHLGEGTRMTITLPCGSRFEDAAGVSPGKGTA